ncbi:TRAP transporter small permease [Corynebacterium comes]|uniref:Tripartite ATP-independent periplasmic transporter, DctQ component n=1 Tax=Corynebacterium comes TaxID=2675218 RepID=A0A6B8W5I4_9CORY|nr:TRAP transporter small permease subunit [Corynebacterium comes]QGU05170.1 Tripartite ATP-independent periplasmic transporter, DctQ component [Corynebacterium comes]
MSSPRRDEHITPVDLGGSAETPHDLSLLPGRALLPQRLLQGIGAAVLLAMAVLVTVAVIMRYLGNGIIGAVEIASMCMVVITVLVIPAATVADENFRVEVADFFAGEKTMAGLNVLSIIVQVVVSVFLAIAAVDLLIHDINTLTTMGGELSLPRWWLSLPVALGFIGVVYSTILVALRIRRDPLPHTALPKD